MKLNKLLFTSFVSLALVTLLLFNVSALKFDGVLDESNWKTAEKFKLVTSQSYAGCAVKNGVVSILEDSAANCLIFGFKVKLSEPIGESGSYGVGISINDSDFIYVFADSVSSYNTDHFGVEYALNVTGEDSFSAEVGLSFKYGLDTFENIRARFIDADGVPSIVFDIGYSRDVTTDEEITTHPAPSGADETEKGKTSAGTTKHKTSKNSVTKAKSTKLKSDNAEYISTAFTAWYENTTDENYTTQLNMKQMMFYDNTFKILVTIILLLLLGVCVSVNVLRQYKMK